MGCTSSQLKSDLRVDSVDYNLPATSPPEPVPPVRPAAPSQPAATPQRQQGSAAEQSSSPVSPFRAAQAEQKDDSAFGDEEVEPETLPPPGFEKLSTQDRGKTNSLGELNRQYGFESVMARQQKLTAANRQSKLLSQLPDTRALDLDEVDTVAPSAASWTDVLHRSSAESRRSKPHADAGDTAVPEGDPVWNTTAVGFEEAAAALAKVLDCPVEELPADTMRALINDTSKSPLELAMLAPLLQEELVKPSPAPQLASVQEAGETQVLAPDLQRKCNALKAIQEKVQAAKQHKELKIARTIAPRSMLGLWRVLWVVLSDLDPALKIPYLKMAVLPRSTKVSGTLIQGLWRTDEPATEACLHKLAEAVLVRSSQNAQGETFWHVHDAQLEFLRFQLQRDPHMVIEAQKHLARYLGRLSTLVKMVKEGGQPTLIRLWQEVLAVDQPEKAYDRAVQVVATTACKVVSSKANFLYMQRKFCDWTVQDAWLNDTPDEDIVQIVKYIANFYNSISAAADPLQVAARTIQQQSDLESMAIAFNNMAMLLQKMGRVSEAEQLLSDALTAREDLWGADSAALAVFLDSTGVYFANTGRLKEAEAVINRSLGIRRTMFGAAHPDVASCLHNLGLLLKRRNEFDKAESVYRECIEIREKVLDPHDIHLAVSYNNLAVLLANMRRRAEAEPLYRKTLDIMEWAYGPSHLDVASCLYNLGTLQLDMGCLTEAGTNLQRSFDIRAKLLGEDNPRTQDVQKKLSALDFEHKAAAMSKDDFNTWVKDNAFTCMGGACAIGGVDPHQLASNIATLS